MKTVWRQSVAVLALMAAVSVPTLATAQSTAATVSDTPAATTPPAPAPTPPTVQRPAAPATPAKVDRNPPSDYLKCDGQPNNMTGGETAARLIGALTLLSIFAPSPEGYNPEARLFAAEGVAACNRLIDGPGDASESNAARRIPLILGRALHQIEAADYNAAIADVARARAEATADGRMADPLFARTVGRAMALIEAEAQLRLGNPVEARRIGLAGIEQERMSINAAIGYRNYNDFNRTADANEDIYLDAQYRIIPLNSASFYAGRLSETGRFDRAAAIREDMLSLVATLDIALRSSYDFASTSLAQALAGNWPRSNELAELARDNMDKRQREGEGETNISTTVELLDMQAILRAHHEGRVAEARRLFSGRSAWPAVGFGNLAETTRRLRDGASEAELIGPLSQTVDQLWERRQQTEMRELVNGDKDNQSLWRLNRTPVTSAMYESMANAVWRVERSRLYTAPDSSGWARVGMPAGVNIMVGLDGILLHSALQARRLNAPGFSMIYVLSAPGVALVRFGAVGDPGISEHRYFDTAAVIAALEPLIPTPEAVRARRNAGRRR
jgi:hypothetical protein